MNLKKLFTKQFILALSGIITLCFGIIMVIMSPVLIENIINSELILSPKHQKTYEIWKDTPITLYLDFYMYNWTNPEDIKDFDTKPNFVQLGPYKFKEVKKKVDIVWNDNGTVSFRQLKYWYFDEEKSNGSLDDEITTLNVVAMTAAFQSRYFSYVMQKGLSLSLSTMVKDLSVTKTVREYIFDGYDDTLINLAKSMPSLSGVTIPPYDKFGWFYLRNGSTDFDGYLNMGTGLNAIPIGELKNWNTKGFTEYYQGECGKVSGSAGEFWPPYRNKEPIELFSPDLCRSVKYDYEKTVEVHGINGYKYIGGSSMMDNGTKYPENVCYCNGDCVPSGVLNVSICRYGSPGFVSFPHFYDADPYYINHVSGMKPNKRDHEFYIVLEPRTGIPLDVAARFQINILLQPIEYITLFNNVPKIFFPILWFEQRASITPELSSELKQVLNLPTVMTIISSVILAVGLTILVALILYYGVMFYIRYERRRMKKYMTKEEIPLNESDQKTVIK